MDFILNQEIYFMAKNRFSLTKPIFDLKINLRPNYQFSTQYPFTSLKSILIQKSIFDEKNVKQKNNLEFQRICSTLQKPIFF